MKLDNKWVHRFTRLAYEISTWSADSTGVGAIIVGEDKNIISTGYNGTPKGVEELEIRKTQEYKKYFIEHAERNAIYLAKSSLKGAILFTTHFPCADCARAIIQTGIKSVYFCEKMEKEHWKQSMMASEVMLKEAKINLYQVKSTEECSFVVAEPSLTKNLCTNTSITSECGLKTIVPSLTEGQKVQIHWHMPGQTIEVYEQTGISQSGKTLKVPMRSLSKEEMELVTMSMRDLREIKE
jgi:dCMP deaminase